MDFMTGFNQGLGIVGGILKGLWAAVVALGQGVCGAVVTAWQNIGLIFLAILLALLLIVMMLAVSFLRFCVNRAVFRRTSHLAHVKIFRTVKWLLIVPSIFGLWFCVVNGVLNDVDWSAMAVVAGALIYVFLSFLYRMAERGSALRMVEYMNCDYGNFRAWREMMLEFWKDDVNAEKRELPFTEVKTEKAKAGGVE